MFFLFLAVSGCCYKVVVGSVYGNCSSLKERQLRGYCLRSEDGDPNAHELVLRRRSESPCHGLGFRA